MRLTRIFCEQSLELGAVFQLDSRNHHYLINVLRVKPGQSIIVFDGSGVDFNAIVELADRKQITVKILSEVNGDRIVPESPLHTVLAIGVSKGERMDYVVQKSVELGVNEVQPLITERVSVKQSHAHLQKKQQHWQAVAIAACEQSGRSKVPVVHDVCALEEWIHGDLKINDKHGLGLTLSAGAQSVADIAKTRVNPIERLCVLVGPEGGLTEHEISASEHQGFVPVGFGRRILRTETAPLVALSLAQAQWGDF